MSEYCTVSLEVTFPEDLEEVSKGLQDAADKIAFELGVGQLSQNGQGLEVMNETWLCYRDEAMMQNELENILHKLSEGERELLSGTTLSYAISYYNANYGDDAGGCVELTV